MLLQDLYRVLSPDQTVVLYDRFLRRLESCFPDEIPARFLGAEIKTLYCSGEDIHVHLRYGSFQ